MMLHPTQELEPPANPGRFRGQSDVAAVAAPESSITEVPDTTIMHPSISSEPANCAIISKVPAIDSKPRKTLAPVFTDPVSRTIDGVAIENLLLAVGARPVEGRGSRMRFEKNGEVATFHRPHPAKEAKRYQVRDARDFLERIGVRP